MRILLLTALTMVAFAANSVLNRMALSEEAAGAVAFAALRTLSGAIVLASLLLMRRNGLRLALKPTPGRLAGVGALSVYMLGFSLSYVTLDAGVGALILFGGVQVTMFTGAILAGERISLWRWVGASVSLGGLLVLMWPQGTTAPHFSGSLLMAIGAVGWGVYSLLGRGANNPEVETGGNFIWTVPIILCALVLWPDGMTLKGAVLAVIAGGVTSGLGYALWYSVLPQIEASAAAIAQLTVPIIAVLGGIILLDEDLTWRFALAACLVLGGILLALRKPAG